jgi:3-oxoacyl-[acyl-carrier protein] reductase
MKARQYGRIINTSSNLAMGGHVTMSHYAAAKSAILGLTKSWAREFAPFNITVNAVAPGLVATNMTLASRGRDGLEKAGKEAPLGRLAEPREISYAVAWLASDEASMMTGQVVAPNGGTAIVGI